MATGAARHTFRYATSRAFYKALHGSGAPCGTTNLTKLVQGSGLMKKSIRSRCLSQLLPSLQIQAANKYGVTPTTAISLIEKCMLSKPQALTLALIESEVTAVDESDDEEDATLYILNEMFSTLCITVEDG